jgi:hypothetical protein
MLPVKSEKPRKWIASEDGAIVPYAAPPKPVRLTTMQQHMAMRVALAHTLRLLTEHGFSTNCIEQSTTSISLTFKGMNFDMSIREPSRIAYITSSPNDDGKRRKIGEDRYGNALYDVGPGVRMASDEIKSQYVVQVIGSKISTLTPLYIDLPKDEPDPVGYVLKNILLLVANILRDQKLLDQADMDTATMTKGKLPEWIERDVIEAVKVLQDVPGALPT